MTLIKSISGIRGTIGGRVGENLTPVDITLFAAAYGSWLKQANEGKLKVVVGRDARISGPLVQSLVVNTLNGLGIDVNDLGLSTTPTVEMAVTHLNAHGGIIITASHNPKQWNALKLLNEKGEFISESDGQEILEIAEKLDFNFSEVDDLGDCIYETNTLDYHIQAILDMPWVDLNAIKNAGFKIVVDGVNSTGGTAIPELLEKLGVKQIEKIYCEPNGRFPHNPEPLPENLTAISEKIISTNADLGIVVDPDVDRLALVCEDGSMFGEEYTLVAVADYVLKQNPGPVVSNLSSTRALRDVADKYGVDYHASAVGEVNVVNSMKSFGAIIGGEGNGGVIVPSLHYGRDALVGVALFLSHLANSGLKTSKLKATYPFYYISKNKIQLTNEIDVDMLLEKFAAHHVDEKVNTIDGVKVDFAESWVHLRKSNTEPIIRIYAEASNKTEADTLAQSVISLIETWI
jgi:phosphomannomutase